MHTKGPWHRHDLHVHASYLDGNGNRRHYAVVDALQHSGLANGEADATLLLAVETIQRFEGMEIEYRAAKDLSQLLKMFNALIAKAEVVEEKETSDKHNRSLGATENG